MDGELAASAVSVPSAGRRRRVDRERHQKLAQLRAQGLEPYPDVHLPSRSLAADILASHDPRVLDPGEAGTWRYLVAGRLVARRKHRHAIFLDLRDQSGLMELCVRRDRLDDGRCSGLLNADIGDIVSAEGSIYVTDNHTLTLSITSSRLLTKSLRSPPGRSDHTTRTAETGHPQRELLASERTRALLEARSSVTGAVRSWLARNLFVELDGPMPDGLADGAHALPFAAAGADPKCRGLLPRRASRDYLRWCLLGGLERVYELRRCSPYDCDSRRDCLELMLQWSAAYIDYKAAAVQAERLMAHAAASIAPDLRVGRNEHSIDLRGPWRTTTVRDDIGERCGIDVLTLDARTLALHLPADVRAMGDSWETVVDKLYTRFVEPELVQPTIVFEFPLAGRGLVKRHPRDERLASDFRMVAGAVELASGNSELNDPHERWARAQRTPAGYDGGPPTACREQELQLLEYGLCPAASVDLRVDRLIALLTGGDTPRDAVTTS